MKKTFTIKPISASLNCFQPDLEQEVASFFKDDLKTAMPGELALRNIIGFAASLRIMKTNYLVNQEVIIN
jgi:hypothetical protein